MGYSKKGKTEAGQGGKLGHSNMSHWEPTEWLKESSKVRRRQRDKEAVLDPENDLNELEFHFEFIRALTEKEQNNLWDDFIETIEKHKISYGGGNDFTHLTGTLAMNESDQSIKQGVNLLDEFADKHKHFIKELKIKPLSD